MLLEMKLIEMGIRGFYVTMDWLFFGSVPIYCFIEIVLFWKLEFWELDVYDLSCRSKEVITHFYIKSARIMFNVVEYML